MCEHRDPAEFACPSPTPPAYSPPLTPPDRAVCTASLAARLPTATNPLSGFICSQELIKPGFLWVLYYANYMFKVRWGASKARQLPACPVAHLLRRDRCWPCVDRGAAEFSFQTDVVISL